MFVTYPEAASTYYVHFLEMGSNPELLYHLYFDLLMCMKIFPSFLYYLLLADGFQMLGNTLVN